jgi:hypothetical protein
VTRESAAREAPIPPLLEAFCAGIEQQDHRYFPYAEFLDRDAPGFLAHLERVVQTRAETGAPPAVDGTDSSP